MDEKQEGGIWGLGWDSLLGYFVELVVHGVVHDATYCRAQQAGKVEWCKGGLKETHVPEAVALHMLTTLEISEWTGLSARRRPSTKWFFSLTVQPHRANIHAVYKRWLDQNRE